MTDSAKQDPNTVHYPTNDAAAKPFEGPKRKIRAMARGAGPFGRYRAGIRWDSEFREAELTEEQIALLRDDTLIVIDDGTKASSEKPLNEQAPEMVLPHLALAPKAEAKKLEPKAEAKKPAKDAPAADAK